VSPENRPKIDRQREHQANERTFLAWLRTCIALIGFGFAIARFGLFLQELQASVTGQAEQTHSFVNSQTLGVGLVITGILLIALSVGRYNRVFWQIERSDYRASRLFVWLTAATVMILGILSIPLILLRQPATPKSAPLKRPPPQEQSRSR
jgi:putative membrane protein